MTPIRFLIIATCFLFMSMSLFIYVFSGDYALNEDDISVNIVSFVEKINTSFFDVNNFGDYGQTAYGITSSDFNNNGFDDFAVSYATHPFTHATISIFYNNGDNTFIREDVCVFNYSYINDLDSGDFNGNGFIDLIFSFSCYNINHIYTCGYVAILFNDGDGSFSRGRNIIKIGDESDENNRRYNPRLTSADYNGNGNIDIIVGDMSGIVELFLNDGKANFISSNNLYNFGYSSCGLSSVDYNGDGNIDVLIIAANSENDRHNGKIHLKKNYDGINLSNNETTKKLRLLQLFPLLLIPQV